VKFFCDRKSLVEEMPSGESQLEKVHQFRKSLVESVSTTGPWEGGPIEIKY
jgi:hypothetical protein